MSALRMITEGHLGGFIDGGDPGTWYPRMWSWVLDRFGIESVLDVGCGQGHSTRWFRDSGRRVLGIDGSRQAIDASLVPGQAALHDFCSGPLRHDLPWDMVWSCEFLEHVDAQFVPHILNTFAQARKAILVTHALPGQPGHHHVNCQPPAYWIEWMRRIGFRCAVSDTIRARKLALDDYLGTKFFAESGMLFIRDTQLPAHGVPSDGGLAAGELPADWRRADYRRARLQAAAIDRGFHWSRAWRGHRAWRKEQKRLLKMPPLALPGQNAQRERRAA